MTQFALAMSYRPKGRWFQFAWGHFGLRVDSDLSYMSMAGICWGVMRPELRATNIMTSDFLVFHQSPKVGRPVNSLQGPQVWEVRLFLILCFNKGLP